MAEFLTYQVTLDEFELDVIQKIVEDMPESMSMSIEEGISFGVLLQIVEQYSLVKILSKPVQTSSEKPPKFGGE